MNKAQKANNYHIFLLYLSIMLLITFIQQEYITAPNLQAQYYLNDEALARMLERWQKWRWVSFIIIPFLLLLRLILVTLCLFVGSFFFAEMNKMRLKDWWGIVMKGQAVIILYSIILCVFNAATGAGKAFDFKEYTSLLFLGGDNVEQWIKLPLSAVNVFEIAYWFVMAKLVSVKTETGFGKSFKFVMSSYGVGYLFYIVLLMFLILYLN